MDWSLFRTVFLARHEGAIDELHRLSPSGTTLLAVVDSRLVRYACCALVLLGGVYVVTTRLPLLTYVAALYTSIVGISLAHALGMPVQYEAVLAPLVAAVAGSHPRVGRVASVLLWSATVWTQLYASTLPALMKDAAAEAQGLFAIPFLFRGGEFADILCLASDSPRIGDHLLQYQFMYKKSF
ncbi:hypothetical protein SPRG_15338 [Saprolegnia parasitica CBS 223.65]|uniref:Uncharacterized protein n=1 Tax=Saprolegnia parasitica (strain CBS 223.65) TaxID=695850 RepID=A0A067BMS2_SAPPC|nr:hypothetical protein SPRG_15338 [Saprolegnia parasitica CBS 223.65]KDO19523.1 hypothetical protein SPRG_15338 [Saprolegnia parasitica CBS 223.65]|eukprot:XP_012209787.1 hypothetical protein SPRG_15338 [Saprolegnia parasitica CBS 223.65]